MNKVQNRNKILSRNINEKDYALSHFQIMNLLVSIATNATHRFDESLLYEPNFIHDAVYCQKSYKEFIQQAIIDTTINTISIPKKSEPPFGSTNKHQYNSKSELEKTLKHLNIVEENLFENSDKKDLLGVEYYIDFSWFPSRNYFDKNDLPKWFEEMGIQKVLVPLFSKSYELKLIFSGMKDEKEVAQKIQESCQQINPDYIAILDYAKQEGDIFSYRNQVFYFRRNNNKNTLKTSHSVKFPRLFWMYALYNTDLKKPVGYSFIKAKDQKEIENDERLLIDKI